MESWRSVGGLSTKNERTKEGGKHEGGSSLFALLLSVSVPRIVQMRRLLASDHHMHPVHLCQFRQLRPRDLLYDPFSRLQLVQHLFQAHFNSRDLVIVSPYRRVFSRPSRALPSVRSFWRRNLAQSCTLPCLACNASKLRLREYGPGCTLILLRTRTKRLRTAQKTQHSNRTGTRVRRC